MSTIMFPVASLISLVGQPADVLRNYGGKTAGNVRLLEWSASSPVVYEVPDGFAIPPTSRGCYSANDIFDHYSKLVRGMNEPRVIMARSSSLSEDSLPGSHETLLSLYDPSDHRSSLADFQANVENLLGSSREMGITVMPMVGKSVISRDGRRMIGTDNLSFYTTTHSPFNPHQAFMSFCHGLGYTAAFHSDQTIPVIAMRESGSLVFFGNMTEAYGAKCVWLPNVSEYEQYRQKIMRVYDLDARNIEAIGTETIFDGLTLLEYVLDMGGDIAGRLLPYEVDNADEWAYVQQQLKDILDTGLKGGIGYGYFGKNPLKNASRLIDSISLARYIGTFGPAQIEGCYVDGLGKLYLYQHLPLPNQSKVIDPISLQDPDLLSTESFGRIRFRGPLILAEILSPDHNERIQHIAELDAQFSETGYTLIAPYHHEKIIESTPHCKVRLSLLSQAMTSHVLTSLWLHSVKPENIGHFAMASGFFNNPNLDVWEKHTINGIEPNVRDAQRQVYIFNAVVIEANGQEFALKVVR